MSCYQQLRLFDEKEYRKDDENWLKIALKKIKNRSKQSSAVLNYQNSKTKQQGFTNKGKDQCTDLQVELLDLDRDAKHVAQEKQNVINKKLFLSDLKENKNSNLNNFEFEKKVIKELRIYRELDFKNPKIVEIKAVSV